METINKPIFWGLALLFLAHQLSQKGLGISLPFLDQYLDTFLLPPLLLTGLLAEWRDLYQLGERYVFSSLVLVLLTLVLLITSEVVFPSLSSQFTADPYDGLSIALGSLFFYLFLNKPLRQGKVSSI